MKYKLLGKSGLRVSELCLGTMTFGKEWGDFGNNKEECKKIFDKFVERGGNFIDTANKYMEGTSEKYVGEFVQKDRESFVIATKYSLSMNPDDPNKSGNHRKNLVQSVNASLKRLNIDYIDLLWLHAWDYLTPVEEVVRALDDLVRQGKILYVGISDTPAWIVSQANTIANLQGWTPFIGLQIEYSLIERSPERELLPMAKSMGMTVTPWGPLGGGVLTGKYLKNSSEIKRYSEEERAESSRFNEKSTEIAKTVQRIASEINKSPAQIALNWIRQQQHRGNFIPILGARTEQQIKDNLGCLDFELSKEYLTELEDISKIPLGFPLEFSKRNRFKQLIYGKHHDDIMRN